MKNSPGFVAHLSEQLKNVDSFVKARVNRNGALTDEELVKLTVRMDADPAAYHPEQPSLADVVDYTKISFDDALVGEKAIAEKEVAFIILAGGSNDCAAVGCLAQIPNVGTSLLSWKLLQAGNSPAWVMVSPSALDHVGNHVRALTLPPGSSCNVFDQFECYVLMPNNQLWTHANTQVTALTGHGDLGPALCDSGILDEFPNVKYAVICNVDNVLARPHEAIIGHHINSKKFVTCEVVDRQEGDVGGCLARVNGNLQIAEDFRLPVGFAKDSKFFNTNTMVVNIDVLKWQIPWRWHRIRRLYENKIVVQYQRFLQQYTEECQANFIHVPRDLRYTKIKTNEDMEHVGQIIESYRVK